MSINQLSQEEVNKKFLALQLATLDNTSLRIKLSNEKEYLNDMLEDLEYIESHKPNRKSAINDLNEMIKEQKIIIANIEKFINNKISNND